MSGPANPDTDLVRANLKTLYKMQGRTADVLRLAAEQLEILAVSAERADATAVEMNNCAWELLTVEPPTLRNPVKGLELARRACAKEEAAGGPELWNFLDTLALAWQMNGNLAAAVDTEKRALALLAPDRPERATVSKQLAEYEARLSEKNAAGPTRPKKPQAGKEQVS